MGRQKKAISIFFYLCFGEKTFFLFNFDNLKVKVFFFYKRFVYTANIDKTVPDFIPRRHYLFCASRNQTLKVAMRILCLEIFLSWQSREASIGYTLLIPKKMDLEAIRGVFTEAEKCRGRLRLHYFTI